MSQPAPHLSPAPGTSGVQLRLDGVSVSYGERRVLTDVDLVVSPGERLGLIGENGSGKSTLLRVAAGLLTPDAGTATVAGPGPAARVGLLHQEPPFPADVTLAEALAGATAVVRDAEAELDDAARALAATPDDDATTARYAGALERAEALDVWGLAAREAAMLAGLGLADIAPDRPVSTLSGGQLARLSLAWLLLSQPDVLLLDEPTNHLDDDAVAHLRSVLTAWRGPVLLASHDRAFLDEAVTGLVDLDPSEVPHAVSGPLVGDGDGSGIGLVRFTGGYTAYLDARLDARERWERRYRDEQAELRRLRSSVREQQTVGHVGRAPRTEANASKKFYSDRNAAVVSRRVNDARTRLAELEAAQVRKPPAWQWFAGLDAAAHTRRAGRGSRWSGPVLVASDVAVAGRLASTSLTVSAGERWLVTGPNGSGKSTLLGVLAGRLAPSAGSVQHPRALRVGLLTQEVDLDVLPGTTVRAAYEELVGAEVAARVPVETFALLAGRDLERPVGALSVGQQRRLALAAVLADPPDVLLLDEPTNHLSLLLLTQLEASIDRYPGAVVVASHDRWLRRDWAGRTLRLG
ncbi:MAG: ABC transporter ATP-binding protein [Micrococcales bacterium 73-15]|uniref:ABC-F family ATP-binding cassette domain-containing protein n=1 Tax=Salana multivorans TaxID=120377 RepID=UPI0009651DF1|nr:ABC-F family ATP-binding cassette domain-containing protein [Salana multivorans]OJX97280.1 MAG: ABC transporter ATP-binding protein [Micrococcales bacterium 73-15]